jgi:hypothetical protein
MVIVCAGYRIASVPGHHRLTFEGAKLAVGKPTEALADYFDAYRRKRNEIDYTGAAIATSTEADELVLHAKSFLELVERWTPFFGRLRPSLECRHSESLARSTIVPCCFLIRTLQPTFASLWR